MKRFVLLSNLAFAMMGVGQVWLVQLSAYPLWAHVGQKEFHDYHTAWWHSIWIPIFVPAGLALLTNVVLIWFRPYHLSGKAVWSGLGILFLAYFLTYIWWAPLMALIGATPEGIRGVFDWAPWLRGLSGLTQEKLYDLLIQTHWGRVGLFSGYGIWSFMKTMELEGDTKHRRL